MSENLENITNTEENIVENTDVEVNEIVEESISLDKHVEEKEVQKEEFYTLMGDNSWRKVIAEPITKYGMELFIHFDNDVWKISHAEVGMSLASGKTKTECMQKLKELIDSKGMDFLNSRIEDVKRMIENRVKEKNPRYNVA